MESLPRGLTTHYPIEPRINRVLLERADRVVVVADHTKLGRKTFAQIAPIEVANTLVTDAGGGHMVEKELRRLGLVIMTV